MFVPGRRGLGRRGDALGWGKCWETGALSRLLIRRGGLDCSIPCSWVGMKLSGYSRILYGSGGEAELPSQGNLLARCLLPNTRQPSLSLSPPGDVGV